jgi:RNA polymerase sigma-70 factor (ECF subfamily)
MADHSEDLALAKKLAAGDPRVFNAFFDEYFPRLYRFALGRLRGDVQVAEEAAQRTLCRAVRKFELYRGEAALLTWLCQICRHEVADLRAARLLDIARFGGGDRQEDLELEARLESLSVDEESEPLAEAVNADRSQLVQRILDHLPARYGDVLEWKYIEEATVTEIAARLSITPLAAESLLARARRAFRGAWHTVVGEPLSERQPDREREAS